MNLTKVLIESERLVLKPITHEYTDLVFAEFTERITLYMLPKPAGTVHETHMFIDDCILTLHQGTNLQLVVLAKIGLEFLGCVGLHKIGQPDPELGLWIKAGAHGNGYGLEGIRAVIEWARANLEFTHFRYAVDKRNLASRRIAENTGGIAAREYRQINQSGFELDEIEYWIPAR